MRKMLILVAALSLSQFAHASKKEEIVAAVQKQCGKAITADDVPTAAIREVFNTCSASSPVDVAGCKICLKDNAGAVVGFLT